MRFNDRELTKISLGDAELEGRLNHRRPTGGNFSQKGFKERWFKLKSNLLFYFRISEVGKIDDRQPAGVFILENSHIQYEVCTGVPFAFSVTFRDEPDHKHLFSGRSEDCVHQWVTAMKQATYGYWRSQLIILQTKINAKTGKDPLLMYPHNQGIVRDFQSHQAYRSIGASSSSFRCHLHEEVEKKTFQSHLNKKEDNLCQSHIQQEGKGVHMPTERNLIELQNFEEPAACISWVEVKMEAQVSSKLAVPIYQSTLIHIPEDDRGSSVLNDRKQSVDYCSVKSMPSDWKMQNKNDIETFEMLEAAFGEQLMGRGEVSEWFPKFRSYVTTAEDAKHSGQPPTNKTDEM